MVIASLIIEVIERKHWGPISSFLHIMAFIGVFVHEVSHYVMSVMVGVKPKDFKVKYRNKTTGKVAPHGSVNTPEFEKLSLMQSFMISIAPLLISTFLFLICLDIIYVLETNIWVNFIAGFFAISLLIGSRPSSTDIRRISKSYSFNPRYSIYQIFLVLISLGIIILFVDFSKLNFPFEFIIYIIFLLSIIGCYFILKYSFRLGYTIYSHSIRFPTFKSNWHLRRRHRALNPNKLGIEEPQW